MGNPGTTVTKKSWISSQKNIRPKVTAAAIRITTLMRRTKCSLPARFQVSMEERMGCGVGACLVCACDMADGSRKHVCKDGPVFDSREGNWDV